MINLNLCKHKFITKALVTRETVTESVFKTFMEESPQFIGNYIYCCFMCGEIFDTQPPNTLIVGGDGWSA